MKIFVIIVTYKGQRWYDKCFSSLRASTIPVQTIVIDNSPTKEDADYIQSHFPEVKLIKPNENLRFGKGNNKGMRFALDNGCDYVFLLNQDAWIEPGTIAKLVSVSEKHPEYGILSPMHMTADMQRINMTLDDGRLNNELLSDIYTNRVKDVYAIKYANAAGWLLPRKALETVGGFCPLIRQYGEDDDYIHRVHYHGMQVGLVPTVKIVHDSEQKVEGSQEFYNQAQRDDMDGFLDITNPISLRSQKFYLFRKCITSWFKKDKRYHSFFQHRYHVLSSNYKEIQRCREQHKIKQASWL